MHSTPWPALRAVVFASVVLLTGSACAGLTAQQKAAVGHFSRAAAAIGDVTSTEVPKLRLTVIEMNTSLAAVQGLGPGAIDFRNLEQQFTVENIAVVARAATTLKAYGEMLLGLVEETQEKELKTAAHTFVGGLKDIPGVSISDENANAIMLAIQEIGGLWIEWKKAQAVRTTVRNARDAVEKIADLLAKEFDPAEARLGSQFFMATKSLRTEASNLFQGSRDVTERAFALAAYQLSRNSETRHEQVLKRISTAARDMKATNAALVKALASDEVTLKDIKAAGAKAKALGSVARQLLEAANLLK